LRSTSRPSPRKTNTATQWLPPVGLIALSLIPVLAGAFRVNELMSRPEITADNARFVAAPIPVAVHIVSVTVYSLLGALQFVPLLRRGRHNWHRIAGRILVPAGALVALTGLWMNFFYPRPPEDGESLASFKGAGGFRRGQVQAARCGEPHSFCRAVSSWWSAMSRRDGN
jgi:uncharacterized membrane protein